MAFIDKTLLGQKVRLEPIEERHLLGLSLAIEDGKLWQLMVTSVPHPDQLSTFLAQAQRELQGGLSQTYVIINPANEQVVGSTRFLNTSWQHARTEIGFTFIAKSSQRTAINTAAKFLLLSHAFEDLGFNRVGFVTDYLNQPSRTAILRLGAKQEGILRNHMVMTDGRIRDSVFFSVAIHEWPGIKKFLLEKLGGEV
ncbi:GNAT family N-acetyltransferase [Marinicella litoralis]|uniref:RimJ/RimL family protein N-acetyltransferase n=1 Tax=Marinicella litoralis TaxID=644220 RepID=A0A4R6XY77_9GAMM|nr:GNAT family protein [Marinicella litoralis]TDR23589.1 RimJ/RimL family protein N-acetyltransferase [Marinicella litoralis]